jgi:hypothetical protein
MLQPFEVSLKLAQMGAGESLQLALVVLARRLKHKEVEKLAERGGRE